MVKYNGINLENIVSSVEPRDVMYVAPLVTEEIEDRYGLDWYSVAAQNKIRGITNSLGKTGNNVEIISPIVPQNSNLEFKSKISIRDEQTGALIHVPPTINFFDSKYINKIILMLTTTLVLLQLHAKTAAKGTLFYNFRLITAVPAYTSQVIFRRPAVLEYEDGLFTNDGAPSKIAAIMLTKTIGRHLKGAICVNAKLAGRLSTDNVAIVRGFPSVGYPDELPEQNFDSDTPIIMFAGTFDKIRGIDTFLSIIPKIDDEDVSIWISGTGDETELNRVRASVSDLDDERVEYFGTLPWEEYRRRIACADIFVNLQDPDAKISEYTFPSKLLDFLSAGGLVVSTDMSDISEEFDDEILITDNTDAGIADTLSRAIKQVRDSSHSNNSGQEWIESNCNHHVIGHRINRVFDAAK